MHLFFGSYYPLSTVGYKSPRTVLSGGLEGIVQTSRFWEAGAVYAYGWFRADPESPYPDVNAATQTEDHEHHMFAFMSYRLLYSSKSFKIRAGTGLGVQFEKRTYFQRVQNGSGYEDEHVEELILPITGSAEVRFNDRFSGVFRSSVQLYTWLAPTGCLNSFGLMYRF